MATQQSEPEDVKRWLTGLTMLFGACLLIAGCESKCRPGSMLENGVCKSATSSDTATMAQASDEGTAGTMANEATAAAPGSPMAGSASPGAAQAARDGASQGSPQSSEGSPDAGIALAQSVVDGGTAAVPADPSAQPQQSECPGGAEPTDETCDNLDEDCDGRVDEGLTQPCGSSARAPCQLGMQVCNAGTWSECSGAIEPAEEVCDADQVDEDCDGTVNEGCDCIPGEAIACGVTKGSCREGVQQCTSEGVFAEACVGEVGPQTERCDGQADEDCDGLEDADDPDCDCIDGQMQGCQAVGIGVCSQGEQVCSNGKWGRCTAKQLNCVCDDSLPARDCGSSSKGECRLGKQRCVQGQWAMCDGDVGPTTERCDGADRDCDGLDDSMDSDAQRSCGSNSTCDGSRCVTNAPPPTTSPGRGFRNGKSQLCIGISGASTANEALAGQFNCDLSANQRWEEKAVGGRVNLVNQKSGLCLGVWGGSTADAAQIAQFNCDPPSASNNQAWSYRSLGSGYFQIVNGKSGKCIGVDGGSTANGASLMQFPCHTDNAINNQSWSYAD